MKRLVKPLVALVLTIVIVIAGPRLYSFLKWKFFPEIGKHEVVKHFLFSSSHDLDKWEEKLLVQNRTIYSLTEYDGQNCVKADSKNSASALFYKVKLLSEKSSFMSWFWRVEEFPSRKHEEILNNKGEFDFACQVYVIFHARFFLNSKAIQYVWAKDLPIGTSGKNPYTGNVKIMVLESGFSDEWKYEMRNIKEDFQNLFGKTLDKDTMAVSFMTDSDSTESSAVAYYDDITLGYLAGKE